MSSSNRFGLFLILLGGVAATEVCKGSNGVLNYEVGKEYVYSYESDFFGSFELIPSYEKTNLNVKGVVTLTPLSECLFILTLSEAKITSGETTENIEKSHIKFTLEDGVVGEIFSDPNDHLWALNVKKAIASIIQNKGFSLVDKLEDTETSVFGECVTHFEKISGDHWKKAIMLGSCGQGEGSDLIFQGVPYQLPLIRNKPIFGMIRPTTHVRCEQKLSSSILTSITCEEIGRHHPVMKSTQKSSLTHTKTVDKSITESELSSLTNPTSIIYDYSKTTSELTSTNAARRVSELLKDDGNKADIFVQMKRAIREISIPFVGEFKNEIKKKTFYDALAEVGSDSAIEILTEAHLKGDLDARTIILFYTHLAFVHQPGEKALSALNKVVSSLNLETNEEETRSIVPQVLLGTSGLAHQYCVSNSQCLSTESYKTLVDAISVHISETETPLSIAALHALGNLNSLTESAVSAVQKVLASDSASHWLKILAIDAFRRDSCQPTLKNEMRKLLSDKDNKDDEIRILAYLALAQCYVKEDLPVVQAVFNEENKGVSTFILSHIRNIGDSSSPSKLSLRQGISDIEIPASFVGSSEIRQSRFLEFSSFNEKQNLGFSFDANVIFSSGVTKPKFVSLNGTIDFFGRSFNLFEIGLSTRKEITTKIFHDPSIAPDYNLMNSLGSEDTYYRIFGTTIGVNLSSIHTLLQMSLINLTSTSTILEAIQPSTLIDEELTFPTLSGLPLTFSLSAVHFDSMKFAFNGVSSFEDLCEKYAKSVLNFSVNANTDSASSGTARIGYGSRTPVETGFSSVGKVDYKHNFGIRVIKQEEKKIEIALEFQENLITLKEFEVDVFGYKRINGMSENKIAAPVTNDERFDCMGMNVLGLKSCKGSINGRQFQFPKRFNCTLEKVDPKMTGFDLVLKGDGTPMTPYEIEVTTPGSDVVHRLESKLVFASGNEETPLYWRSADLSGEAELGGRKYTGRVAVNQTEPAAMESLLGTKDYTLVIEYQTPNAQTTKLVDFKSVQPTFGSVNVVAQFGGPLALLGNIEHTSETSFKNDREKKTHENRFRSNWKIQSDMLGSGTVVFGHDYNRFPITESNWFHNDTFFAEGTLNGRVWRLEFLHEDTQMWELVDQTFETETYKVYITKDNSHVFKVICTEPEGTPHEIQLTLGQNYMDEAFSKANATIDIICTAFPGPIKLEMETKVGKMNGNFEGNLTFLASNEKKGDLSVNFDMNEGVMNLAGEFENAGNFDGKVSLSGPTKHVHMVIVIIPLHLKITSDTDITDDGNEIKEKSKVVTEVEKTKILTESFTVINRKERTMSVLSKTTKEEKVLSKFNLDGKFPEHLLNGTSSIEMRLEDERGHKYSCSLNDTITSGDKILKKHFVAQLNSNSQNPWVFIWDCALDTNLKDPQHYDFQGHVTSNKKLTGEFMSRPFELDVTKEVEVYKKKEANVVGIVVGSNMSFKGEPKTHSEMNIEISASDDKWEEGEGTAVGFTDDTRTKFDMKGKLLFKGQKQPAIQNLTFSVDKTDLQSKETKQIILGSINKTTSFHNPMEFEMIERGRVKAYDKTYYWWQLIRMHKHELTFFKEIRTKNGEDESSKSDFLLDVSAKVFDENDQTKLHVKSHHHPQFISNLNFTISK